MAKAVVRKKTAPTHHRRIKRRLPALARVSRFDLTKVEGLQHKRQNETSQVVLADTILPLGGNNSG